MLPTQVSLVDAEKNEDDDSDDLCFSLNKHTNWGCHIQLFVTLTYWYSQICIE